MTKEQILQKAIERAFANGWAGDGILKPNSVWHISDRFCLIHIRGVFGLEHPFRFIFNHDFAKAFWGEEIKMHTFQGDDFSEAYLNIPEWRFHLTQMVLLKDPIKYLERFL